MLSEKEFSDLSSLARLDPEDEGLKGLRSDFNKILDAVNSIEKLDLKAENHALPGAPVVRPDEPVRQLTPVQIGSNAPEWEAGHFVVPGVIQSE